ncbi:MAG: M23 family metallopeptidase [Prolixibacteraceae bacterium]|nr:M23 family metallopeptidase [Prolixibacteraceae bacterium]
MVILISLSCSKKSGLDITTDLTSIDLKVTFAPIEVKSTSGKVVLIYSVESLNFEKEGYKLKDFQVLNAQNGNVLCSISDTAKNMLMIHKPSVSTTMDLYAYPMRTPASYRFSVGLEFDRTKVPQMIKHRLVLMKDVKERIIETAQTPVLIKQLPVLSSPFKGNEFVATNTTALNPIHSSFQTSYKGISSVPERFCVDWLKLGADGKLFHGDLKINENWYVYGQNLYAASDGEVIFMQEGMPDQIPFEVKDEDFNLYNGTGNCVVLYTVNGYLVYGHMIKNSILVTLGQMVTKGQMLGKVGNSGNSSAPHLHFGLHSEFPYYVSEGLPYYIDSMEKTGSTGSLVGDYAKLPVPEQHINELMENFGVYNLK